MVDGINPLDPLGPIVGRLGQGSSDPNSYLPFEGETLSAPVINFPDHGADRRNTIGTPGIPSMKSGITKTDLANHFESLNKNLRNKIAAGRGKNEFATYQTYDGGPDGNAFYDKYMAYGQEKFDEVGFHPFRDNEANFNANTTWWDDFKRMTTHSMLPLMGLGFKAGPKSLAKMLHGDFTGSDLDEAKEYERAAAIGQSSKDGIGAFFNNTAMNFTYTAGIITEIIAEEYVLAVGTALTGGGLSGAAVLRTGQNIIRGVEAVSTFGKMYDRTRKMINSFSDVNAARQFWKAANTKAGRFINPLENTFEGFNQLRKAHKAGNQIDGLAVLSKTVGGFYRDARTINMAVSEARLEAGMVENHLLDGYYSEFYADKGKAPDEKEIRDMQALAKKGSLETFYTNAGLIYLTNKITFNNITGPRGGIRNFMQSTMDDIYQIGARSGEKNFGNIGKILYDNTKKEFIFKANNLKNLAKSWWKEPGVKTLGSTIGYFKANVSEGIQENLQETIARANEKYYNEVFKNSPLLKGQLYANGINKLGYKDVNGIFNTPLEYYKEELGKEFSKQGAETFASGFLMGTFASPLNNAMPFLSTQWNRMYNKESYQKWKDMKLDVTKNIVQQLNSIDLNEFVNNRVVNLSTQDIISTIKKNGSYKEAFDAEIESFTRSVGTMMKTGTTDIFINKLKSYKDLTDEELIDAVKGDNIKDAPMYRERIDKSIAKLEKIQKKYETAEERFPNPVNINNLDKNKMSAIEYNQYAALYNAWEEAKYNYVFFNEAFEDTAKRMVSIEKSYLEGSALQNVEYGSAKNLFRPNEIQQDIVNLETELELEKSKGESKFDLTTDGLTKKRIKLLEQQISDLKEYNEAYAKFNKFYNRGEVLAAEVEINLQKELGRQPTPEEIADRINELEGDIDNQDKQIEILDALKKAHDKYLRNLAENSNSTVFQENLDSAFNKLLDYYKLGNEAKTMAKSVDILNDPQAFADLVGKNLSFMRRLYNNRSEFFEQMVNEQIDMIENNALLNALANQGLFVNAEDFAEYIKTGKAPSEIYDHSRKVVYKEGTEMYNQIYQEYFVKNEQLKNQSLSVTPTFVDDIYQKAYEQLTQEAQRKIDALPKNLQTVNQGIVKPLKGTTMSLREVLEQMQPEEYVKLDFEGSDGILVIYYLDENGVLRVDGPAGGTIDLIDDTTAEFTSGLRYTEELAPDPVAVEQIQNELKQQIDDLVDSYKEDKTIEEESGKADTFVPLSTDTDIEDFPSALRKELKDLYDSYLKNTMVEEDYVNMTQDEYESGFNTFVKSGSALVKEAINKYNKSQEVDAVIRTKGVKDDFEFEFAGKTYNTKDLTVPDIRSYQRQIRNNIETLSKTDPILPSLEILIVNLDKVVNKKLLTGFSSAQSEAIKKIQELKAKQKDYKVDSTGYTIAGDFYKRVTQIIQPLKSKKQSYIDAAKVEKIFNNVFAVNGFTVDSINDFISQLRDKKLSGFSEFTYNELEQELKSLLAKGEEVFIPINREVLLKNLIENFAPDTIEEISEIGVNENNKIAAFINGTYYTKEDLEESSKDPRAAKNKALFTKLISEVDRLQKLLDDQIAAIPESTAPTTPVSTATDTKADIEKQKESYKKMIKGTPINKDAPKGIKIGDKYDDRLNIISVAESLADNFDKTIADNNGLGYEVISKIKEYGEMENGVQTKAPKIEVIIFNNKADADAFFVAQKAKLDKYIADAELAALKDKVVDSGVDTKADIKRKKEETIASIKEGYNGGKTWEYIGQFSSQATKFTNYELFQNEYTKDQVIDEINAKYDAELDALEKPTISNQSEIEAKINKLKKEKQEKLDKLKEDLEKDLKKAEEEPDSAPQVKIKKADGSIDTNSIRQNSIESAKSRYEFGVNRINAKYDPELAALEGTETTTDTKASLERRRIEEAHLASNSEIINEFVLVKTGSINKGRTLEEAISELTNFLKKTFKWSKVKINFNNEQDVFEFTVNDIDFIVDGSVGGSTYKGVTTTSIALKLNYITDAKYNAELAALEGSGQQSPTSTSVINQEILNEYAGQVIYVSPGIKISKELANDPYVILYDDYIIELLNINRNELEIEEVTRETLYKTLGDIYSNKKESVKSKLNALLEQAYEGAINALEENPEKILITQSRRFTKENSDQVAIAIGQENIEEYTDKSPVFFEQQAFRKDGRLKLTSSNNLLEVFKNSLNDLSGQRKLTDKSDFAIYEEFVKNASFDSLILLRMEIDTMTDSDFVFKNNIQGLEAKQEYLRKLVDDQLKTYMREKGITSAEELLKVAKEGDIVIMDNKTLYPLGYGVVTKNGNIKALYYDESSGDNDFKNKGYAPTPANKVVAVKELADVLEEDATTEDENLQATENREQATLTQEEDVSSLNETKNPNEALDDLDIC